MDYTPLSDDVLGMAQELDELGGLMDARLGTLEVICSVANPTKTNDPCVWVDKGEVVIRDPKIMKDVPAAQSSKRFRVSAVAEQHGSQDVNKNLTSPVSDWVWDGFNATVLSYGQSGTGKSTCFFGDGADDQLGMFGQVMRSLFTKINLSRGGTKNYAVGISCWELYQNHIIDLLESESAMSDATNYDFNTIVAPDFESIAELFHSACRKSKNWSNPNGSSAPRPLLNKSHFFVRVFLYDHEFRRLSTLHMVDLIGSFPYSESPIRQHMNEGERAVANKQLLAFNRFISELAKLNNQTQRDGQRPDHLVSARESKLTLILAPLLTGNAKTFIYTTVSSDPADYLCSLNTMRVATRAMVVTSPCSRQQNIEFADLNLISLAAVLTADELRRLDAVETDSRIRKESSPTPRDPTPPLPARPIQAPRIPEIIPRETSKTAQMTDEELDAAMDRWSKDVQGSSKPSSKEHESNPSTNMAYHQQQQQQQPSDEYHQQQSQQSQIPRQEMPKNDNLDTADWLREFNKRKEDILDAPSQPVTSHEQSSVQGAAGETTEILAQMEDMALQSLDVNEELKTLRANYHQIVKVLKEEQALKRNLANRISELEHEILERDAAWHVKVSALDEESTRMKLKLSAAQDNVRFAELFALYEEDITLMEDELHALREKNIRLEIPSVVEPSGKQLMSETAAFNSCKRKLKESLKDINALQRECEEWRRKERQFELHRRCLEDSNRKLLKLTKHCQEQDAELKSLRLNEASMKARVYNAELEAEQLRDMEQHMETERDHNTREVAELRQCVDVAIKEKKKNELLSRFVQKHTLMSLSPTKKVSRPSQTIVTLIKRMDNELELVAPRMKPLLLKLKNQIEMLEGERQSGLERENDLVEALVDLVEDRPTSDVARSLVASHAQPSQNQQSQVRQVSQSQLRSTRRPTRR